MKTTLVKTSEIKPNPDNPRIIRDDKFAKLVESIRSFPSMLHLRPIVVNTDMVVLGGNMRLRACKEAGMKQIPVIIAEDITEAQQREFIIKDNVGFGEWNWDALANEWEAAQLEEWGMDVPKFDSNVNLDDFFQQNNITKEDGKLKIVLEYTEDDYNAVQDALKNYSGTKEQIFYQLLGL